MLSAALAGPQLLQSGLTALKMSQTWIQIFVKVLIVIILLSIVVFGYLFLRRTPPRSWKFGHVGEDSSKDILRKTSSMILRLVADYGDDISEWFSNEKSMNSEAYKNIVKEWHARADESYISPTYILCNTKMTEEVYFDPNRTDGCKVTGICDLTTGAMVCDDEKIWDCERDIKVGCKENGYDTDCKDFSERVFDECPRVGKPPCFYVSEYNRKRDKDLFFGTPRELDIESLYTDLDVWFNEKSNNPIKPIMKEDFGLLRSIENVELLFAILPWFYKHIKDEYAIFRYCSPKEIMKSHEYIKDPKGSSKTNFIKKYEIFKGRNLKPLKDSISSGKRVICMTRQELFESIYENTRMLRAIISLTKKRNTSIDDLKSMKSLIENVLETNTISSESILHPASSCMTFLRQAEKDLENAEDSVDISIPMVRIHMRNASEDFSIAIDKLISIKESTDSLFGFMSISFYPALENRKTIWNDILDLINYDESDIDFAYDRIKNIMSRVKDLCPSTQYGKSEILEADYKRFVNLLRTIVYTGTFIHEAKRNSNIYHINRQLLDVDVFYKTVRNDLSCSYIHKHTFEPHESETGATYNVQSAKELCTSYWDFEKLANGLKDGVSVIIDSLKESYGF